MMKPLGTALMAVVVLVAITGDTFAQQTPGQRRAIKPGDQRQAIEQQRRGQYPAFNRELLPKGAINYNWATKCRPDESTQNFLYQPGTEIRVRTRQLIGTVLVFPERVAAMTSGLGNAITLNPYPKQNNGSSRIWVLGSREAGLDGNLAFIGGMEIAGPRIYSLRVQTEGVNTENCPDLVVNIKSSTDKSVDALAGRIAQAIEPSQYEGPAMPAVPTMPVETADLPPGGAPIDLDGDETGRQHVDWLESFQFDPTKLDFRWKLEGDAKADFAPDIVFSDDEFMYLQWDPKRWKQMMLPAISVNVTTDRGVLDAPVLPQRRGNTLIIQRVANLTLELEGVVVCVKRDIDGKEGS